jgi:hypothetical protein
MYETQQIFDLNEVSVRANLSPGVKSIHIYNGHVNDQTKGRAALMLFIKRDPNGSWPAEQMAYINKLKGNFTVVLKPSNEFFYITSGSNNDLFSMQGVPGGNENIIELVNRITALEAEKVQLLLKITDLEDELKNFESASDKFSVALEKLFFSVAPKLGLLPNQNNTVMNGTNTNEPNWQNTPVSNELTEENLNAALYVIYDAFGDDFIVKFAQKIQRETNLVNQLKMML